MPLSILTPEWEVLYSSKSYRIAVWISGHYAKANGECFYGKRAIEIKEAQIAQIKDAEYLLAYRSVLRDMKAKYRRAWVRKQFWGTARKIKRWIG